MFSFGEKENLKYAKKRVIGFFLNYEEQLL